MSPEICAFEELDGTNSSLGRCGGCKALRLDFAPIVSFEGDADFPLKGGTVGYFLDRKAAVLVYARRLHPISLFVFRAGGPYWPAKDGSALTTEERGFNVVMRRQSSLGYALVPDVDRREFASLAAKLQSMP